jgi:hypothetical protein
MATRERSTAYPSLSLCEAAELVAKVRNGLGSGEVTREQIAPVIGHEKLTGPAASKIGAMAHYGLLDKGRGTYRVSELAVRILSPLSDDERVEALQIAALEPSLFRAIYDKYLPDGKLPQAVEAIMNRQHGVTREAAKVARENLVATLAYAGLMDESDWSFGQPKQTESCGDHPDERGEAGISQQQALRQQPPLSTGGQVYELPMSSGTAKLSLPSRLTAEDFNALESLVGVIKHFVQPVGSGEKGGTAEKDE